MPSWLPGDDYMTNFRVGAPYVKVDEGYARLPGAGYEAIHPDLKGLNAEDYPDINKLAILADVAPYSRQFHTFRQKVGAEAENSTELKIEYEKILDRVRHDAGVGHPDGPGLSVLPEPKHHARTRANRQAAGLVVSVSALRRREWFAPVAAVGLRSTKS